MNNALERGVKSGKIWSRISSNRSGEKKEFFPT